MSSNGCASGITFMLSYLHVHHPFTYGSMMGRVYFLGAGMGVNVYWADDGGLVERGCNWGLYAMCQGGHTAISYVVGTYYVVCHNVSQQAYLRIADT